MERDINVKLFTAEQARKATEHARDLNGTYKRAETEKILDTIRVAAQAGKDSATTGSMDEIISRRLENLGYTIKWTEGYDQRDQGYNTIYW